MVLFDMSPVTFFCHGPGYDYLIKPVKSSKKYINQEKVVKNI